MADQTQMFKDYLAALQSRLSSGNTTERSNYDLLKNLCEHLKSGISTTIEPKRIDCGAPDLVISAKKGHGLLTIGYIEATRTVNCHGTFYLGNKGQDYLFPLYLYSPIPSSDNNQAQMSGLSSWPESENGRTPNLSPSFVDDLTISLELQFISDGSGDLQNTFGPEDIFYYVYAVLHSPSYRNRYEEFLRRDFPRIPLTSDIKLFRKLVALGGELVSIHLVESSKLNNLVTRFPLVGDDLVEKGHPRYIPAGEPEPTTGKPIEQGRVYISKGDAKSGKQGQYFEGVTHEVWEFQIGGYQPLDKWLKDRRGRKLSYEDKMHYQRIVVALQETMRLMDEIDEAIPGWPLP